MALAMETAVALLSKAGAICWRLGCRVGRTCASTPPSYRSRDHESRSTRVAEMLVKGRRGGKKKKGNKSDDGDGDGDDDDDDDDGDVVIVGVACLYLFP